MASEVITVVKPNSKLNVEDVDEVKGQDGPQDLPGSVFLPGTHHVASEPPQSGEFSLFDPVHRNN